MDTHYIDLQILQVLKIINHNIDMIYIYIYSTLYQIHSNSTFVDYMHTPACTSESQAVLDQLDTLYSTALSGIQKPHSKYNQKTNNFTNVVNVNVYIYI